MSTDWRICRSIFILALAVGGGPSAAQSSAAAEAAGLKPASPIVESDIEAGTAGTAPGDTSTAATSDRSVGEMQPVQYATPADATPPGGGAGQGANPAAAQPAAKKKPPPQPWKLLYFDNDFSYKQDPNHTPLWGENLKDIPLDDRDPFDFLPPGTRISTGGELRFREMDEGNRLRPGPPGRGDYQLWRWRHYVDLKVGESFRVYAEMIDASMDNNPLPTTGIDVNRWDVQNLFFDWRVAEWGDRPIWFRCGRQELSYGSQRLVSPLDWANTRRNFAFRRVRS